MKNKSFTGESDVEWFIRRKGCWRRFHKRVEQVAWIREEVLHTLRVAGFHRIRAHDATEFFVVTLGFASDVALFTSLKSKSAKVDLNGRFKAHWSRILRQPRPRRGD